MEFCHEYEYVSKADEIRGNSRKRKRLKCFGVVIFFGLGLSFLTVSLALFIQLDCHSSTSHSFSTKNARVIRSVPLAQNTTQTWLKVFQKSPLLDRYCNMRNGPTVGLEGFVPPDYQLIQVHIVLSPATDVPLLQNLIGQPSSHDQYHHSNSQHHHSNHSSDGSVNIEEYILEVNNLPLNGDNFSVNKDDVRHQHFIAEHHRIGMHLKKIYLDKWNLETSRIGPKHFVFSADDSLEAYSSLLATLFTFLPRNLFRSLRSDFISTLAKSNISRTKKRGAQTNEQQQISSNNFIVEFSSLKSIFKQYFTDYNISLYEFLLNVCTNINLPSLSYSLSEKQAQSLLLEVQSNIDVLLSKKNQDEGFLHFSDTVMFSYLDALITRLHKAEQMFQKIFVHTLGVKQIYHLLSALRYEVSSLPKLGSRVVFELYKSSSDRTSHYIRVLYNGEDITHSIPLCSSKGRRGLCDLKYFVDYHKIKHMSL